MIAFVGRRRASCRRRRDLDWNEGRCLVTKPHLKGKPPIGKASGQPLAYISYKMYFGKRSVTSLYYAGLTGRARARNLVRSSGAALDAARWCPK